MANKKLSELTQITSIATGDLLLINDISEAEGLKSKSVSIQQLDTRYQAFQPTVTPIGEMYQLDNIAPTLIDTIDEWVKVEGFTEGVTQNTTFSGNSLTIAATAKYLLTVSMDAIGVVSQARNYEFAARVNGVVQLKTKRSRGLNNSASGAMSLTGILDLTEDDVVDLVVRNTDTVDDIIIINSNFTIHGI